MKIKQRVRNNLKKLLGAALASTLIANAVQAQDTAVKPTVAYIENAAQGRNIDQENYAAAIDLLEDKTGDGIYAFYAANNLCVAQLKMGYLTEARVACDKAVSLIQAVIESPRRLQWHDSLHEDRERFLAIALSNRGVVNAAVGRDTVARDDFSTAIAIDSGCSEAKTNLAWLKQRSASGA